jgi:hypothetical protein
LDRECAGSLDLGRVEGGERARTLEIGAFLLPKRFRPLLLGTARAPRSVASAARAMAACCSARCH